jgi:hypothetical protein
MNSETKKKSEYIDAVEEAILAIVGHEVYAEMEKAKGISTAYLEKICNYINEARFNVDCADFIEKRKHFFQPFFICIPVDGESWNAMKTKYNDMLKEDKVSIDAKKDPVHGNKLWARFKDKIKHFCWNVADPIYRREYSEVYLTGVTSDEEILFKIWEKSNVKGIEENADKVNIIFFLHFVS